jgi:hypothetical protein
MTKFLIYVENPVENPNRVSNPVRVPGKILSKEIVNRKSTI